MPCKMTEKPCTFGIEYYGKLQKFLDNAHTEEMVLLDDEENVKAIKDWILENCDCVSRDTLSAFGEFYAVQLPSGFKDIFAVRSDGTVFKIGIHPKKKRH